MNRRRERGLSIGISKEAAGGDRAPVAMLQETRRKIARLSGSVDNPRQYIPGARPPGRGYRPALLEKIGRFRTRAGSP